MNIAYIRGNNAQSIENQKNKLNAYNIDKWYIEETRDRERTAFKELISNLKEGDTIYIIDFSRISRDFKEFNEKIDTIKSKGAIIKALNSPVDIDTPAGRLMLNMALAVAEELDKVEEKLI